MLREQTKGHQAPHSPARMCSDVWGISCRTFAASSRQPFYSLGLINCLFSNKSGACWGGKGALQRAETTCQWKTQSNWASTSAHFRHSTDSRGTDLGTVGWTAATIDFELFDYSWLELKHKCMQTSRTVIKALARQRFSLRLIQELQNKSISETCGYAHLTVRHL